MKSTRRTHIKAPKIKYLNPLTDKTKSNASVKNAPACQTDATNCR